jgi:hypothetical protein
MIEQDKRAFKEMMITVMSIYNKKIEDQNTLRIWFMKLEKFEFQEVATAFNKWIDENKYTPTPADILSIIKTKPIEFTALPKPKLSKEQSKVFADNVIRYITDHKPQEKNLKGMRDWATRIINNPEKYPAISLQFAKEAIRAN